MDKIDPKSMIEGISTVSEAVRQFVQSGQTLLIGGFARGGVPFTTLEYLANYPEDFRELTLAKIDANEPDIGIDLLLQQGMVKKLITSHIGLNPNFITQMNKGEIACEFVPQGIFAERIRAGGAGIPAFLTDIGLGTEIAEGATILELDGKKYIAARAIRGDVAIVRADIVDRAGNCWWRGSNRNTCIVMATACDKVIVEAEVIKETGSIEPENIHLPGMFTDAIVQAKPGRHQRGA